MDRQTKLLPLIAAFKIGKACLLFTLAFGLHHLRGGNAQTIITDWAKTVRIDPESRYAQLVISKSHRPGTKQTCINWGSAPSSTA